MARTTTPLNNTKVDKAKHKEYNLANGERLQLRIKSNGSKLWIFNYSRFYTKKHAYTGFGKYPEVTLAQASAKKKEAR